MPKIAEIAGYRFAFFSNEGDEPPHVHVDKGEREAKFWLAPVELAENHGFRRNEISELRRIIEEKEAFFLDHWHERFGV